MKRPLFLAALLSLTVGAPRAFAGETPVIKVRPGAVATAVVTFTTPVAGEAARFSVQPVKGVRILGATTGLLPEVGGTTRRIPVTFTVPADASAGEMVGGSVTLEWAGGRTERRDLRFQVDVVRRLVLSATSEQPIIRPGGGSVSRTSWRTLGTRLIPYTSGCRLERPGPFRPRPTPAYSRWEQGWREASRSGRLAPLPWASSA